MLTVMTDASEPCPGLDGHTRMTFSLKRYRRQYDHLFLVCWPFLALVALVVVIKLVVARIGGLPPAVETMAMLVPSALAVLAVVTLPRRMSRWRDASVMRLIVDRDTLHLQEAHRLIENRCPRRGHHIRPGVFEFQATMRFAGGVYRAPKIDIVFDEGRCLAIGGTGTAVCWTVSMTPSAAPDVVVQEGAFMELASVLGLIAEGCGDRQEDLGH